MLKAASTHCRVMSRWLVEHINGNLAEGMLSAKANQALIEARANIARPPLMTDKRIAPARVTRRLRASITRVEDATYSRRFPRLHDASRIVGFVVCRCRDEAVPRLRTRLRRYSTITSTSGAKVLRCLSDDRRGYRRFGCSARNGEPERGRGLKSLAAPSVIGEFLEEY